MSRSSLFTRRVRRVLLPAGCLALGSFAASCEGDQHVCPLEPISTSVLVERISTSSRADKLDLLLAIDNSRSMADKQQILAIAVPDLVQGIVNPPCLDQNGQPVGPHPKGPLAPCPAGSARKTEPLLDVHIGIISSSLGGHGSDACPSADAGKQSNNDRAHLLARKDATQATAIESYQGFGFLAWDPDQLLLPPGEGDILADGDGERPDANSVALVPTLTEMVFGVGQVGCGYEAQLESWYRFLVDPSPPEEVTLDADDKVLLKGIDTVLLAQRKAFLRPDSLLAILQLTDENDCSIRESGQFYFAAQQKGSNGSPFHLPKARTECETNPNDDCCFSCGQSGPKDDNGDPLCPADPSCKTADGKTVYLDEATDNINLRCFNQKRRFGIDFLYGTDRYVDALQRSTVTDRNGEVVANPIFSDLDPTDDNYGTRSTSLVFFAGLVGVPWQDIARTNDSGMPDLRTGLDPTGKPSGGFKNADEMHAVLPGKDYTTWDLILGDPDDYPAADHLPRDPLMIESVGPRTGANPITGDPLAASSQPLGNAINGHEWTIGKRDDLQYACTFPLVKIDAAGNLSPDVRDCSMPGALAGCDCDDTANDNPLCEVNAATGLPTNQVRAKAYPGIRELQVIKGLGSQGIVASVCPAQLDQPNAANFGYRPAIQAILDRLIITSEGGCLQRRLSADAEGRVACAIIEGRMGRAGESCCKAGEGRIDIPAEHQRVLAVLRAENPDDPDYDCYCEIPQLSGDDPGEPLWSCQNDMAKAPVLADGEPVNGYCYVDENLSLGNPELVVGCPASERRLLRFVGAGAPRPNAMLHIACGLEENPEPDPECIPTR